MKIKFTLSFQNRLLNQIDYIANDSPIRARKFYKNLILKIKQIPKKPLSFRKSIYFNEDSIRDLIFNGYTITFKINNDSIEVFGFVKEQSTIED